MKVSIIVPVYNAEKYLHKCISSLVNQTYEDIQLILVDDNSSDKSGLICDKYAEEDDRVEVIHNKDKSKGVSYSRNRGLSKVAGEYFCFVDSDDWIDLDYIDRCVKYLRKNNVDILFTSFVKEYRNQSIKVSLFKEDSRYFRSQSETHQIVRRLYGEIGKELTLPMKIESFSPVWAKFYKSISCKEIRFPENIKQSEDLLFNVHAFYGAQTSLYLDEVSYHYNKSNDSSVVSSYTSQLDRIFKLVYEELDNFAQKKELDNLYLIALNNRKILNLITIGINEFSNEKKPFLERVRTMKEILSKDIYCSAFKKFEYSYLPIPYKVLLKLCEKKRVFLLGIIIIGSLCVRKSVA